MNPVFSPENISIALAEANVKLAEHMKACNHVSHHQAQTIRSIIATASSVLDGAGKLLNSGDTETALQALGIADGACRLVAGLVTSPNDPLVIEMSKHFRPKNGVSA